VLLAYLLNTIYLLAAALLAVYGSNALLLTWLFLRVRSREAQAEKPACLPSVTLQLPVYNERWVIRRIIDAIGALDYPRDLLEVQVLDDSTDDTTIIAQGVAERWRKRGLDIRVIHRSDRSGYKAGALSNGLRQAKGELVAIFDADFVPPRDWLMKVVPHFCNDERLGFVQTRWGHVNGGYSATTQAQVLALDGHFIIEQTARQRCGLLMNFNGTAGVWRRACIEDAGGWSSRTLSEDLDLSYRAQLRGWRTLYLPEVVAPAEVPPQVIAFKNQQRRWATGSVQCLRHLLRPLLRSGLSSWQKIEGIVHLGGYLCHPLMVILLLLSPVLLLLEGGLRFQLTFLSLASLGPPLLYIVAQAVQGSKGLERIAYLPVLVMLGTGLALSNTLGVLRGLMGDGGDFQRTPKFRLVGASGDWRGRAYALGLGSTSFGELMLSLYAVVSVAVAWHKGSSYAVPFLALYACGFAYVAFESIRESRSTRVRAKRAASVASGAHKYSSM